MALIYNNTEIATSDTILYNGNELSKVMWNGITIWEKKMEVDVVIETLVQKPYWDYLVMSNTGCGFDLGSGSNVYYHKSVTSRNTAAGDQTCRCYVALDNLPCGGFSKIYVNHPCSENLGVNALDGDKKGLLYISNNTQGEKTVDLNGHELIKIYSEQVVSPASWAQWLSAQIYTIKLIR